MTPTATGKSRVIITHYINPTMFWFKYQAGDRLPLLSHETALQTFANSIESEGQHQPVRDEIVLVKHLAMDKWVRCKVQEIIEINDFKEYEYAVWLIDYGQPLITHAKWIRPLDMELALFEIPLIYKAGLANIVPAAAVFNMEKGKTEFIKTENWSEYVVTTIEELLTNNDMVSFIPEFNINTHFFGNLEVITCAGRAIKLRDVILSIKHGCLTYDHQEFSHDLKNNSITNFRHFESQLPQSSFAVKKNHITESNIDVYPENSYTRNETDWHDQNPPDSEVNQNPPLSHIKGGPPFHFKPGDDSEAGLMACAGSIKRHQMEEKNKQPDVVMTNPMVNNYLARLRNRNETDNIMPKQFHRTNRRPESPTSNISSSSSSDQPILHKSQDIRYSKSSRSTTSDEPKPSSSDKSKVLYRSQLSLARSRFCPSQQSKEVIQNNEKCLTNSDNRTRILVHSQQRQAEPISRVAEANFTACVHKGIKQMCISNVYHIQSVAWPHILRGNSIVLINNAVTGRTMSFLPAICSLVQEECVERIVPDGVGPTAVIVCVSSVQVFQVAGLCRKFLSDYMDDVRIVEGFGERNINHIVPLLLNGCGIFVCTVPNLHRLLNLETELNQQLFDRRRIKHLVLDDIDMIVGRFSNELKVVMESFCRLNSNGETDVQIVVTSRVWHHKWQRFFRFGMNPILCIGAFIEAAVYARTELQMKFIARAQKIDQVLAVIQERNYMENRTIVVCSQSEEVLELVGRLKILSITTVYCHDASSNVELSAAESWNRKSPPGQNTVLVCTDDKLFELNIKSAQNIIHYSLPLDWNKFSFRFSAMSEYFENFVVNEKPSRASPFSLVLLDENNNQQLPRLIDFMLEHDVTGISDEVLQLAQKIRRDIEDKRRIEMVPFCPNILLLGECSNIACKYRHSLTYADRSMDLPRNGRIKMEILHCHSPSHYSVRILEHVRPGATHWTRLNHGYLTFSMNFQNHYVAAENHQAHVPVLKGDLCVVPPQCPSDPSYYRCQVIQVNLKSKTVDVRLIDVGISLQAICCDDLLKLAVEFADFPSQAVDVRIANLIPFDYDTKWDGESMANVTHWLQNNCTENVYIDGTIQWSNCLNTIWVDTLRLNEKLCTQSDVFVLSIKSNLLDKKFGIVDDQCLSTLQKIAASCGIFEETRKPQVSSKVIVSTPINPNRGRRIPSRHSGTPYTAKSSSSSMRSNSSELKTSKSASDINGVSDDSWVQMPTNVSQSVFISSFHTPWRFYVQILSPELYKLFESIDKFTSVEHNRRQIHEDLTIGMMCLGKAYGEYNRAKVTAIECNLELGIMVTVFFYDIGQESTLLVNELLAIPIHLVEMEPFQAILCSLIGIRPTKNDAHWDLDLCDRMYDEILKPCTNMAIRPVQCLNLPQSDLDIRSYDCVLIDKDDPDQNGTLNELLVSSGFADYDALDRHHLTVNRAAARILNSDDDYEPESWDDAPHYQHPKNDVAEPFEDGVINFEYNFTDGEIMEAMRSLLNLPSNPEELLGMNTSESSESHITEFTDSIGDLDSVAKPILNLVQPDVLDLTDPIDVFYRKIQMPALKQPAAIPNVKWQQSNTTILLLIEAPDVREYNLHVTPRSMQYSCIIGDIPQLLHINLLGCIDTEYTSHEVRGLSVHVRLIKTLRGTPAMWPRLLADNDRHRWLKYNTDAISLDETPKNQFKNLSKNVPARLDSDDSDYELETELQIDHDNADPFSTEFE